MTVLTYILVIGGAYGFAVAYMLTETSASFLQANFLFSSLGVYWVFRRVDEYLTYGPRGAEEEK